MSNIVIVDLDGPVCDFATTFHQALLKNTGKDIPIAQWSEFYVHSLYDITHEAMFSIIENESVLWQSHPVMGAKEALEELQSKGYEIHIVTSRNQFDSTGQKTIEWLVTNDIPYDCLTITCHSKGKAEIAQSLEPVMMIDDHDINILECADYCQQSILLDFPWNQHLDENLHNNVTRMENLAQAASLLPKLA